MAHGDDGVCPAYSPLHSGLFESLCNDVFITRLNHAEAGERAVFFELGVRHAFLVLFEVADLAAGVFGGVSVFGQQCACLFCELLDTPVVRTVPPATFGAVEPFKASVEEQFA